MVLCLLVLLILFFNVIFAGQTSEDGSPRARAAGGGRQAPRVAAGRVLLQAEAGPARVRPVLRVRARP